MVAYCLLTPTTKGSGLGLVCALGQKSPDISASLSSAPLPAKVSLAAGEAAQGIAGWRLSHRQAMAALPIALREPGSIVCYSEVALLASMLQDDLLATSLHERYLVPLNAGRDGGEVARETLRAYFAANRNASSAAAALGVNRRTVTNRLQAIEERSASRLTPLQPRWKPYCIYKTVCLFKG